jgi:K+ transporter
MTATVLAVTLVEKFMVGGWLTVLVTSAVIALCFLIKRHYSETRTQLAKEDAPFAGAAPEVDGDTPAKPDPSPPTAIVLVADIAVQACMRCFGWPARFRGSSIT